MIYVTDYLDSFQLEKENTVFSVVSYLDSSVDKEAVQCILVWHQKVDSEFLDQFPNLRFVQRYGVGYDNIDLRELRERKILFANNPAYGVEEVATTALALVLDLSRGVSRYTSVSRNLISKKSSSWQENIVSPLKRVSLCTLGIIGFGRIGQRLAHISSGIFNNIICYDPFLRAGTEKILGVQRLSNLNDFLKASDVVSLHCPLNEETKGMVNYDFVDSMRNGSILVNTARGGLIEDTNCLREGLKSEKLFGVGLDVLPVEPPGEKDLLATDFLEDSFFGNLIINPHTAYYSQESYVEMRISAIKNCEAFLQGRPIENVIE